MHDTFAKTILVGFGGNLSRGKIEPKETILSAVGNLEHRGLKVEARSGLFKTPAFPARSGPDFVNAAVRLKWDGSAREALAILNAAEADFARDRGARWGPRTLDLDLLAMGQEIVPDRETFLYWQRLPREAQAREAPRDLVLPHPRIQDRAFVLVPLAEIAPDWRHPVLGQTVTELRDFLPMAARNAVRRLPEA